MATKTETTRLEISPRETGSSRATRRLRREGRVPGVLYGRGQEPITFSVDARELRHALAGAGAVLEVAIEGKNEPAVLKSSDRHPVRGEILHVDLLRVDLNKPIQAQVAVELIGGDEAPGVAEGGILEHVTREITIEALPSEIPESISAFVSEMVIGDTLYLSSLAPPPGVTIIVAEDAEDAVIATLTAPRLAEEETTDEELETETEVVGEGGEAAPSAEGEGESGGDGGDAGDGE
ncbi:MAG TPA: 50S ribosomal protein L25 [Solirubrobacteraceae bacterium]